MSSSAKAAPFPVPVDWVTDESWTRILNAAGIATRAKEALGALRRVFSHNWIKHQAPTLPWHPFAWDYSMVGGRFALVELGAAIRLLQPDRVRDRLRRPNHYHDACAELRTGLILDAFGARIEHEPAGRGHRGPDFLAMWPGEEPVPVEVKCPNESNARRARETAMARIVNQVQLELHLQTVDSGVSNPPVDLSVDFSTVQAVADAADPAAKAREVASCAVADLRAGRPPTGGQGVCLERRPNDGLGLQVEMVGEPWDEEHEDGRIVRALRDAARQLRAPNGRQGLVVLDTFHGSWPLRRFEGIVRALGRELWAIDVAGVLLVDRILDPGKGPDCRIFLVPGCAAATLPSPLMQALQPRPCGHVHPPSLLFPRSTCGWASATATAPERLN